MKVLTEDHEDQNAVEQCLDGHKKAALETKKPETR